MQKVFIGLLVGICVIMFSSPLMAADLPEGIDLSTLQALDDSQLNQVRGKKAWSSPPPGIVPSSPAYGPLINAEENLKYSVISVGPGGRRGARNNSRVFQNLNGGVILTY